MRASRRQRLRQQRRPCVDEDKNIEFNEHDLAELVRQNMRANNVPTSYRSVYAPPDFRTGVSHNDVYLTVWGSKVDQLTSVRFLEEKEPER